MIEASDLPESDKVFLKKDFLGYRVVLPIKNSDGSVNWFNLLLGGRRGIFMLILVLLLSGMFYLGVKELIGNYQTVAENPCNFCPTCQNYVTDMVNNLSYQLKHNPLDINISWVS